MTFRRVSTIAIVAAVALAQIAYAATPLEIVTRRQNNFKEMGRAMKAVSDEVRKPAGDIAIVRANAAILKRTAAQVPHNFPRNTRPSAQLRTKALPTVWERSSDFQAAARRLNTAVAALEVAARGNDIASVRPTMAGVGGACKGCHDVFKAAD